MYIVHQAYTYISVLSQVPETTSLKDEPNGSCSVTNKAFINAKSTLAKGFLFEDCIAGSELFFRVEIPF